MNWFVNVFLVETANGLVLVDGAIATSAADDIRALIRRIGKPLLAVLVTHGHPDHYTGIGAIVGQADVPILATRGAMTVIELRERTEGAVMAQMFGADYPSHKRLPNRFVVDGEQVTFDGVAFRLTEYGPCESDADAVWDVTLGGIRHVFAADLVYNHMHAFVRDGHLRTWLTQLDRLQAAYDVDTVFHTGHGPDFGIELIAWQRAYLEMFRHSVRELLNGSDALDTAARQTLLAKQQSFLPNDNLIFLAQFELEKTVELLRADGAV